MTDLSTGLPTRIVQMVPRFRPDVDGLGECALNLGNALLQFHGIPSHYLVAHPPLPNPVLDTPSPQQVTHLASLSAGALDRAIDQALADSTQPQVLLLHYVGYGYSTQGTPLWLPGAIEDFRERGGRVVTLFHELYARGRFPSKTFFASIMQRRIFRQILALSDAAFTSSNEFLTRMQAANHSHRPLGLIGICSNAGEPEQPAPLARRRRRLVVFGKFERRRHLYERHGAALLAVARHLGLDEIADIGPVNSGDDRQRVIEALNPQAGGLVRAYGALSTEVLSALLDDSLLGAAENPYALAGKSGVIAAYQAHATPVLLFPYDDEIETVEPGSWALLAAELLSLPARSPLLPDRLRQAGAAGHAHYRQFRSARAMAETLLPALANSELTP